MRLTSSVHAFRRQALIPALIVALATLLLPGFSAPIHAQFLHPKIKSKQTTIRTVVVFPAKVNVVRDSMKGPEGMAAESEELSARVEKTIAEVLAKQKKVTTLSPPTAASAQDNAQPNYNVADFQTKFDDIIRKCLTDNRRNDSTR